MLAAVLPLVGIGCVSFVPSEDNQVPSGGAEVIIPPAVAMEPSQPFESETAPSIPAGRISSEDPSPLNPYAKEQNSMNPIAYELGDLDLRVTRSIVNMRDTFTPESLLKEALQCQHTHRSDHKFRVTLMMLRDKRGYRYGFELPDPDGEYQGSHSYVLTVFANHPLAKINSLQDFRFNFDVCQPGSELYPLDLTRHWLLFESGCLDGYTTDGTGRPIGCEAIRNQILGSLLTN